MARDEGGVGGLDAGGDCDGGALEAATCCWDGVAPGACDTGALTGTFTVVVTVEEDHCRRPSLLATSSTIFEKSSSCLAVLLV